MFAGAKRRTALAGLLALIGAAAAGLAGCCDDVTTSTCLDWSEGTTCPSRAVAAAAFAVDLDQVTSAGTYWPAHDYLIEGEPAEAPASCCYDVQVSVCTTELH